MQYVQNPSFMKRLTEDPSIKNKDGTVSTHKMAAEKVKGQWYAFPMIIQQEDGSLKEHTDWKEAYNENRLKNNLMRFGKDKEAALSFAEGGYKENTPLEGSHFKNDIGTVMFKHFTLDEFDCKETGKNHMSRGFIILLDDLREECGFPFQITSGYRDPSHSEEVIKSKPGLHSLGIAVDIRIHHSDDRHKILEEAFKLGFTGIGIAKTFIHLDMRQTAPVVWLYS